MFAKPPTFKPYASIKNSERKNVLAGIEKQLRLGEQTPEVKQQLLPKSVQSAKAVTADGEKIVVYSEEQVPLWVVLRGTYVPTVALLSSLPADLQLSLLPIIYTVPNTVNFLKNGADFMIPGIFGTLPGEPTPKGTPVQIRELSSKALMAVGLALVDLSQVKPTDKGKGIQTFNVVGDKLTPGVELAPMNLGDLKLNDDDDEGGQPQVGSESAKDAGPDKSDASSAPEAAPVAEEPTASSLEDDSQDEPLSQEEADDAFDYAVAKVIRQPQHKYPMTMAGFAALLGENMPYEHPGLTIKATSYKKMGKLLKAAEKKGQLVSRERQGGEVIVVSVNPPEGEMLPEPVKPKSSSAAQKQKNKASKMTAVVVYRPKPALRTILPESKRKDDYFEMSTLLKSTRQYISANNLANSDASEITPNETLRDALGLKKTVETLHRDDLGAALLKSSTAFHKIIPPGRHEDEVPLEKGPVPIITIKTERRGGNKVVTLIGTGGVAGFHIDPQQLADELRHACAGSSTISNVKGFEAIVVQGNHVTKVRKVLEKRGIKSSWIVG